MAAAAAAAAATMATSAQVDDSGDKFGIWLHGKLKEMNTDPDVFAAYIRSILEGDDADDEKLEALEGILVEIVADGNTVAISQEFLSEWNDFLQARSNNDAASKPDVDAQLATIMEKQAQAVVIERKSTVDQEYRNAILLQYSHVSDGEAGTDEEDESVEPGLSVPSSSSSSSVGHMLSKNTNAEEIQKAEKEKREKAKAESAKKKALDKANREKQKQQQQERKEKEKKRTQKGERKR